MKQVQTHRRKVGILIPCYNLGQYITVSINSLNKQTFADFEVVIVDDCSTDTKTIKKLKSLSLPDNYSLVFEKHNLGLNKLANKYVTKFQTEYVMVLSADDKLHPDFLLKSVQYLDEKPTYAAVSPWIKRFGVSTGVDKLEEEKANLPIVLIGSHFLGSALTRKTIWDEVGGYDTSGLFERHQDYEMWIRILEKGHRLGVIPKVLFYYRQLSASASHSTSLEYEKVWMKNFVDRHADTFRKYYKELVVEQQYRFMVLDRWVNELQAGKDWLDSQYYFSQQELKRAEKTIQGYENQNLKTRVKNVIKPLPHK